MRNSIVIIVFVFLFIFLLIVLNSNYLKYNSEFKMIDFKPDSFIIKKRTPDFILLDTPEDKSFKNFCIKCKKNLNDLSKDYSTQTFLISGACSSCDTPNIPK